MLAPSPPVPPPAPGVVAAGVYAAGRRIAETSIADAGAWARKPGHVVWIGLYDPSDSLLHQVQEQFGLHPLAIEDAGNAHQRPKMEQYGSGLFVVARTAQLVERRIAFGETHVFLGRGYVVTVRHGPSSSYAAVRQRCEACPSTLAHGEHYMLYALLDYIVDDYGPVIGAIHDEVEAIEDTVLARSLEQAEIERLYMLRRDLLRLRTAVVPLVEVCRRLEHAETVAVDEYMQVLFRDVSDHIRRVQEEIDSLREVLAFAFEASLMIGQTQQTHIARRLAAWAAILAVPTAVAGIYGMNFKNMPELELQYGYFFALGAILMVCLILYRRFRAVGWL